MHNIRKITEDMYWIGGNDRKLRQFEGSIPVPRGISYNSYFINDEKSVLLDTVDNAVSHQFFDNLEKLLTGKKLDYVIINHMEPDHSATLKDLLIKYPEVKMVGTDKTKDMAKQFMNIDVDDKFLVVEDGEILKTGKHELNFIKAPMVHWPEVMVTYDKTDEIVYSADAFGTFGALAGAVKADPNKFDTDWLEGGRKYYTNIVGKYGMFTEMLLNKLEQLNPKMICPLHGPIIDQEIGKYLDVYHKWARYEPEVNGVLVIYASVYGNTQNAVEILAGKISDLGVEDIDMYDVSVTDPADVLAMAFKYSHILVASTTYNGGIFLKMEDLLLDIRTHNLSNRKIAIIENGSWGPTSGGLMRKICEDLKDVTFLGDKVTIRSSLKENQMDDMDRLAGEIAKSVEESNDKKESTESSVQYVCKVCGYVYEEEKYGKWEELPDDFVCPVCKVSKDNFIAKSSENNDEKAETATKYVCKVCGYVYEEEKYGKWEELPDDFVCPVCKVSKDNFIAK